MTPSQWRAVTGPLITLVVVIGVHIAERYVFAVPNAAAIALFTVVISAELSGLTAGLVSALLSLGVAMTAFRIGESHFGLGWHELAQLAILMVVAPLTAITVGVLRMNMTRATHCLHDFRFSAQRMRRELSALRAGLDSIEVGMVLLDHGRQVQYINRAFRRIWRLPDEFQEVRPTFARLMTYQGRDDASCALPRDTFDACVAKQLDMIQNKDDRPVDIRLANGDVYRFGCKALPGGGSFVSYGNITDLVRQADALEELASIDGLTRLYNRRHFLKHAENEWARFRRYGRPSAMILIDIDHFKSVNDRYGHDVGDRVLVEVANLLHRKKRAADIVARLGGEEFALLLPETPLESACSAAQRLRQAVADRVIVIESGSFSVTISLGVSVTHEGTDDIAGLMKEADIALYDAKKSGRNRVCAFGETNAREDKALGLNPTIALVNDARKTA